MSWVAAGTAAVGIAGKAASSGGAASGGAVSPALGAFTGGSTGDFNVGVQPASSSLSNTQLLIIAGVVLAAGGIFLWHGRRK